MRKKSLKIRTITYKKEFNYGRNSLGIGCGATIQTTDKAGLGFTPSRHLKKGLRLAKSIANAVSVSATTMKSQMSSRTNDDFLELLARGGRQDALVVNVIDIFDFNGSVIPGFTTLRLGQ